MHTLTALWLCIPEGLWRGVYPPPTPARVCVVMCVPVCVCVWVCFDLTSEGLWLRVCDVVVSESCRDISFGPLNLV